MASDLLPADAALRQDRRFASVQESPGSRPIVAFNVHRPAVRRSRRPPGLRRASTSRLSCAARSAASRSRRAAHPSGCGATRRAERTAEHGQVPLKPAEQKSSDKTISRETVEVTALIHPSFAGEYVALLKELNEIFREMGFLIRPLNRTMAEYVEMRKKHDMDLVIGRWASDYPDADTFVYGVMQTAEGFMGHFCGCPEIDQLAERGRAEIDPRIRHSIYRQVEEVIARDALLVTLFHEQVYRFVQPDVEGLSLGFSLPTVAYEKLSVRR